MQRLQLEVGKTYVNRAGSLVTIIAYEYNRNYQFKGNNFRTYNSLGEYLVDAAGHEFDLIEEYKLPVQPSVQPTKQLPDIIDPVINKMCWDMVKVIGSKDWFNELKPALYEALKRYHKEYLDKTE